MKIWHLTPETLRFPFHVSAGQNVNLQVGTWPIEDGQKTWIDFRIVRPDGTEETGAADGTWNFNRDGNSDWFIDFGPFGDGDRVEYGLRGISPSGATAGGDFAFLVGPKIHLAILWHQHQPLYKDLQAQQQKGSYPFPWVRLHAIRDYYSMAAILDRHPQVHLTINLTPVLLWQIEDYAERGATDRALDLTLTPTARLSVSQREEILGKFFEADWHTQIFSWPRYRELFEKRRNGEPFSSQDLTDLQMWFNLAWFAPEFQEGKVELPDGSVTSVRALIEKGGGYTRHEIEGMVDEQLKIMRNIVPIHRRLQDRGQIEVSTTPFFHPILPLIVDTDQATIDRDGAVHPTRFHRPEDATAQIQSAVEFYQERFGRPPRGMWPAEGAVGQSVVSIFAASGSQWIATDRGVLAQSGRYGYDVHDPNVLCQAYRVDDESGEGVAVFFRDTALSDKIGFQYQRYEDAGEAAADFLREVKERFAWRVDVEENRAWDLLREAREVLGSSGATPKSHPKAFQPLYAAEGSDWFWWFGEDQASDSDAEFDDLFRAHLKNVYRAVGRRPPAGLDAHIVPHAPIWTFARPIRSIQAGDRLIVRTNCAGRLIWRTHVDGAWTELDLVPAGGAMAGLHRYGLTLGPFGGVARFVEFRFRCTHPACCGTDPCCQSELQRGQILAREG